MEQGDHGRWNQDGVIVQSAGRKNNSSRSTFRCCQAEALLAFWVSIGFKPGDFMTTGMSEQRAARLCRAFNGATHRASLTRFGLF